MAAISATFRFVPALPAKVGGNSDVNVSGATLSEVLANANADINARQAITQAQLDAEAAALAALNS
jgi:hypothetical protein